MAQEKFVRRLEDMLAAIANKLGIDTDNPEWFARVNWNSSPMGPMEAPHGTGGKKPGKPSHDMPPMHVPPMSGEPEKPLEGEAWPAVQETGFGAPPFAEPKKPAERSMPKRK